MGEKNGGFSRIQAADFRDFIRLNIQTSKVVSSDIIFNLVVQTLTFSITMVAKMYGLDNESD